MVTKYREIVNARLCVGAEDATYAVQFAYETLVGKTWEFDPNSDAIGQYTSRRTEKIKVFINPVEDTMSFPEDAKRPRAYVMSIEDARIFYKFIRNKEPHFWFALDMASYGKLKGFDKEFQALMMNCAGCATNVESV